MFTQWLWISSSFWLLIDIVVVAYLLYLMRYIQLLSKKNKQPDVAFIKGPLNHLTNELFVLK